MTNVLPNLARQRRKPDASILVRHLTEESAEQWRKSVLECGIAEAVILHADPRYILSKVLGMGYAQAATMTNHGLICSFDDDDLFEEDYFTELEGCFHQRPDAAIIGKYSYPVRWMATGYIKEPGDWGPVEPVQVSSVAGPTIAVNCDFWHTHANFRHDPEAQWADDGLIKACHKAGGKIYTTSARNFFLQRYPIEHEHGWPMPDPVET